MPRDGDPKTQEKKRWQKPSVEELGNLRNFVQVGTPGKPADGFDSEPVSGPEMFMAPA